MPNFTYIDLDKAARDYGLDADQQRQLVAHLRQVQAERELTGRHVALYLRDDGSTWMYDAQEIARWHDKQEDQRNGVQETKEVGK